MAKIFVATDFGIPVEIDEKSLSSERNWFDLNYLLTGAMLCYILFRNTILRMSHSEWAVRKS